VAFLTPLALGFALFAIPIILLYMLRLRRREVPVSSTLLWTRLMQDREANAPWQRLRRNLLMLLQLLILALLVLALARPFLEVPTVNEGSVVVLLDASASMNATDVAPSRFERARAEAGDIIEKLGDDDTMTLVEVGASPRVLVGGSSDKDALRDALGQAQVGMAEADWGAALTLAAASAQLSEDFSTVIISDGGMPDDLPSLPGSVRYVPVGEQDANLAITALSARPVAGAGPELYAQITNFGAAEMDVIFSLELDGELNDAANYTVPAYGSVDVSLTDLPDPTLIRAALTRPAASTQDDYLAVDDEAWAVYVPATTGRVLLVSEGNRFVEQALLALPGVQPYLADPTLPLPESAFDLYIFDRVVPETLPPGDLLFIGPAEDTPLFTVAGASASTALLRVAENDARMAFVTFNNVHIADFAVLDGVEWATSLVEAEGGPLVLAGEQGGRQVVIFTFDLFRSDLPLQTAWPVLVANLLEWFAPSRAVDAPDVLRPTGALSIRPALAADSVVVTRPDGATRTLAAGEDALTFSDTALPGMYRVEVRGEGDEVLQEEWFAVNLFAEAESRIAPRAEVVIGTATLEEAGREAVGQQELWTWLALAGLFVLAVEWYIYHRGMRLPSRLLSPIRRARR
jgi:hypothetical protein